MISPHTIVVTDSGPGGLSVFAAVTAGDPVSRLCQTRL
jgi:glutamate racemase